MKLDKSSTGHRKRKLKEVRRRLESSQLNAVRELLPDSTIRGICGAATMLVKPII